MKAEKLTDELFKGTLKWYDFKPKSDVLCIEEDDRIISDMLKSEGLTVTSVTIRESAKHKFGEDNSRAFDYIIAIRVLERCYEPIKVLERWRGLLKSCGRVILGMDNRLGIKYFCGDRDPYTNCVFDGIEDYGRFDHITIKSLGGRLYGKGEIDTMLSEAGFSVRKYYSVMPNLAAPQLIYAEDKIPNEDLAMRYTPLYNYPDTVFLPEAHLYDSLIKNGLFHLMANSYLIECAEEKISTDVCQVTLSTERGKEQAFATIIYKDKLVRKKPLYAEGRKKLFDLYENDKDLRAHGVSVVASKFNKFFCEMPYIEAELGNVYLQKLLMSDKNRFIQEMDKYREIVLSSSEQVEENELGVILKRGYIDLVPLNCFYIEGEYIFFDQEFYWENLPANVILHRALIIIYDSNPARNAILPSDFFYERYGMSKNIDKWDDLAMKFTNVLRNQKELSIFNNRYSRDYEMLISNHRRINCVSRYESLIENCFEKINNKKIILFGSGRYADKFLAFYKDEYDIDIILDNNSKKWGTKIEGIEILSPDCLWKYDVEQYKVIICVKKYEVIYKQLRSLGVKNIGIYDADKVYSGRQRKINNQNNNLWNDQKKYNIGYISGTFDLFHIGHLNMFRRAKEKCNYLIAGVVEDEYVEVRKQKKPFIPFEERIEIVRSCKYVDEAVRIPFRYGGTVEAYQKYHFDCQFCGSDYEHDSWWLEQKQYLEKHGAELVFFPYTQQTSSTKIKDLIEKGLM